MKRILLVLTLGMITSLGFSQEVFFVFPPATSNGAYEMTWADGADWSTPDITNPLNNVTGVLAMADDGQELDDNSLNDAHDACEDIINGAEIDGKIAVVYRGLCEFGAKALRCQDAGAIAVIIINRDNEVIQMGGGVDGPDVTIPVVMLSSFSGEIIVTEMNEGNDITALIGTNAGAFASNVASLNGDYLRTNFGAHLAQSSSLSEELFIGTWVRNFGTEDMDVTVNATIFLDDNMLYDEASEPITISPNDTAFFSMPNYAGGMSEAGIYTLTYDINIPVEDEFPFDNSISMILNVNNEKLAYCRMDANGDPIIASGTRPADMADDDTFSECIVYHEANGSETNALGLYFAASIDTPEELIGQLITASLYQWFDEFEDLNDDNFGFTDLDVIASTDYEYLENLPNEYIFVPFEEPVQLEDDQRYMFCVTSTSGSIRLGFDGGMDMGLNQANYLKPFSITESNGEWFGAGFGVDNTATVIASLAAVNSVNETVTDSKLEAYPNPAIDMVQIPFTKANQVIAVDVYDVTGKLVLSQSNTQKAVNMLKVDVSTLETGLFTLKATFENGSTSNFNVVVTK